MFLLFFSLTGYLRCKFDDVCVHPDQICDGVVHCPFSRDDERACHIQCLNECDCVKDVMVCSISFRSKHQRNTNSLMIKTLTLNKLQLRAEPKMFIEFYKILLLNLSRCQFHNKLLLSTMFAGLAELKILYLTNTKLRTLPTDIFKELFNLKRLLFTGSQVISIAHSAFPKAIHFKQLDISGLSLTAVSNSAFCNLFHLLKLNLSNNALPTVKRNTFDCLENIIEIDLRNNNLGHMGSIEFPMPPEILWLDSFSHCCYLQHIKAVKCRHTKMTSSDPTTVCKNILFNSWQLETCYWMMCVVVITLNVASFLCKHISHKRKQDVVFCSYLISSDILIGVYLFAISILNAIHKNNYFLLNDDHFLYFTCPIVVMFPIVSHLMSNTTMCYITVQRLLATKYHFAKKLIDVYSSSNQHLLLVITCVFSCGVAMLYLSMTAPDNAICFAPFYSKHTGVVVYIICVYIVCGGATFIASCIMYYHIITYVISVQRIRIQYDKSKSALLPLRRKIIIVLSCNFASWVSLTALVLGDILSKSTSDYVDKMLLVCILPMNSIMNPYIYTFMSGKV